MTFPNVLIRVVQINVFLIVSLAALLTGCGGGGAGVQIRQLSRHRWFRGLCSAFPPIQGLLQPICQMP